MRRTASDLEQRGAEGAVTARRFAGAAVLGTGAAFAVFLSLLLDGHWSLLQRKTFSALPDAQAHAFLAGRLDIPARVAGIEGIAIDGKTYQYFGPFPALLRLPVAAFTDRFDGRLTQISMLIAFVVAMAATARILWCVRMLGREDAAMGRGEWWAVVAFMLLAGCGSVLVFLASLADVYHEAALWGVALALAAFAGVMEFIKRPSGFRLAGASALAAAALLSRGSVGAGPVVALGVLFAASLWTRSRVAVGLPAGGGRRLVSSLGVACFVPIALYCAVNYAKFGSLVGVPFEQQVASKVYVNRMAALDANDGSLFGFRYVPTTLVQYFRPDAIRPSALLPWFDFPSEPTIIGDATFDRVDLVSSIPASMPALFGLAVVGIVAMVRRSSRGAFALLRAPVIGAACATIPTLGVAELAHRYMSDFVPLLMLLGSIGFASLLSIARRGNVGWALAGLASIAAVWSLGASIGLAVIYQHTVGVDLAQDDLRHFVEAQHSVYELFPGGVPPNVRRASGLPRSARRGDVVVIGECRAVYWYDDKQFGWRPLFRQPSEGEVRLSVRFPTGPPGSRQVLLATGPEGSGQVYAIRYLAPTRVVVEFLVQGRFKMWSKGRPFTVVAGRRYTVDVALDARIGQADVWVDGRRVYSLGGLLQLAGRQPVRYLRPIDKATIGKTTLHVGARPFEGSIRKLPPATTSLCSSGDR